MMNDYLLPIAIAIAITAIYLSEVSNPCAAWVDTPCEYRGYSNG